MSQLGHIEQIIKAEKKRRLDANSIMNDFIEENLKELGENIVA